MHRLFYPLHVAIFILLCGEVVWLTYLLDVNDTLAPFSQGLLECPGLFRLHLGHLLHLLVLCLQGLF